MQIHIYYMFLTEQNFKYSIAVPKTSNRVHYVGTCLHEKKNKTTKGD